ncbi:hypothetical protein G7Y89_g2949 [Cudoniella acicularis]|uniref:Amidoligase enzyme-domain-containing protein n=1 Tax=Cudoniella acicularis TaxID=354080 RepID=A0A8H4RUF4_9HELO|nr:hypothetical protein G7Y89_g2949 [Cudoniella acicularis]
MFSLTHLVHLHLQLQRYLPSHKVALQATDDSGVYSRLTNKNLFLASIIGRVASRTFEARAVVIADKEQRRTPRNPKAWQVKEDPSICPPNRIDHPRIQEAYYFLGIELVSPPYYYSLNALDIVKRSCEVLSITYRISCNESCGFHVHVGNGKKGFDIDTVTRFYATAFMFEPQIDRIHPSHRNHNLYCPRLRQQSRVALQGALDGPRPFYTGLGVILNKTKNLNDLHTAFRGSRLNYNMLNLISPHWDKKTIEFRQHESTLDPERVTNWIRFCYEEEEKREKEKEEYEKVKARFADEAQKQQEEAVWIAGGSESGSGPSYGASFSIYRERDY